MLHRWFAEKAGGRNVKPKAVFNILPMRWKRRQQPHNRSASPNLTYDFRLTSLFTLFRDLLFLSRSAGLLTIDAL